MSTSQLMPYVIGAALGYFVLPRVVATIRARTA